MSDFTFLANHISDVIIWRDSAGKVRYISPSAERILGYPLDDLMREQGDAWLEMVHPDDVGFMRQRFGETLAGERLTGTVQYRYRHADGHYLWIESSSQAVLNADGQLDSVIYVNRDITERKLIELALEQKQREYETLVNTFDGVVWEADARSFYAQYVSPQVETMLGYSVLECLTVPSIWELHMEPDDYARNLTLINSAIETQEGYQIEYRMRAADGRIVWIREMVNVVPDERGVTRAIGTMIDITEYKRAQAAALEARTLAEAMRDSAAALTSTLDPDEVLDEILRHLANVVPHDTADIMLIEGTIAVVARSKGTVERGALGDWRQYWLSVENTPSFRIMSETGRPFLIADCYASAAWRPHPQTRWIRAYLGAPIRLEGRVIGFLNLNSATPKSFTEAHAGHLQLFADQAAIAIRNARLYSELERRVEARTAELVRARSDLQAILDSTGDGIFYSEGLTIQYVNPAMCELTGYSVDELVGQPVKILRSDTITDEEKRQLKDVQRWLRRGEVWRDEARLRRKDGSEIVVGITASLLGDPNAEFVRAVTIMRDISQEKALQAQKSRFVAHASHELRTPITNMVTRLYLLRKRPERLDEHLGVLEQVTARMRRLVEDLLDVSRFERGIISLQPQNILLQDLVLEVVRVQQPDAVAKEITLEVDVPAAPLSIYADPERITQVVTNLIVNAVHYTPNGGEVRVRLMSANEPGYVLLRIEDNGAGIAPDHLPHLFEPFYRVTGEKEGTGLGLSIAKEIVELHGGTIEVESVVGQGTSFSVRLPVVAAASA